MSKSLREAADDASNGTLINFVPSFNSSRQANADNNDNEDKDNDDADDDADNHDADNNNNDDKDADDADNHDADNNDDINKDNDADVSQRVATVINETQE